ncbi:MAG TPA: FecR domain-containing protein [Flavipsychrobacter sp.]
MKQEQSHINDDLLVKHLLGEATAEEQAEVMAWVEANEANRKYYSDFKLIWDNSKNLAAASKIDEGAAWQRFQQRVATEKPATSTIPLGRRINWMRVAAILVLMVGGAWMARYMVWGTNTQLVAGNVVITETLPDGTTVTLNKGAVLEYNSRMRGNTRKVSLEGEAFFDVTPDKNKPFVITADDTKIKVVGTSFNVKSTDAKTEVIVETGIVEVSKRENAVMLKPNEKATVLQSSEVPLKEAVDDVLYNYYRTKELVCKNTPLWRLVDVLNDAYNVNIEIGDARLKNMEITTTFKNQSLDDVLEVISRTLNVRVEKNGKNIVLR